MRPLLPAIAFCAVLQAAAAPQVAGQAVPAAASRPAAGILHAQLVTPSTERVVVAQRVNDAAPGKDSLQPATSGTQPAPGQEHRPTTAAMLLAALILMTGIALRRWGAGEQ
jgi:hypothetical protein